MVLMVQVKLTKSDGTTYLPAKEVNVDTNNCVTVNNLLFHTLFQNVNIKLNNTAINANSDFYYLKVTLGSYATESRNQERSGLDVCFCRAIFPH